jgi:RND family efflux transporter MFP subunit
MKKQISYFTFFALSLALSFTLFVNVKGNEAVAGAEQNAVEAAAGNSQEVSPVRASEHVARSVDTDDYIVQAVLSSGEGVLISAPIDGSLNKVHVQNGDKFKKGQTLVSYDCQAEKAKVSEIRAKLSVSNRQLEAYERLKAIDVISEVEYVSVLGQNNQDKAILSQALSRRNMCDVKAPFDGRVQDKQVENHEVVKSGRLLMKITSAEPLHVEMLVPSVWLRWLNVGANLNVYIRESDRNYEAEVIRIHGEVDPVSQSVHIVAKIEEYQEELLPGMSGRATFERTSRNVSNGFMGLSMRLGE